MYVHGVHVLMGHSVDSVAAAGGTGRSLVTSEVDSALLLAWRTRCRICLGELLSCTQNNSDTCIQYIQNGYLRVASSVMSALHNIWKDRYLSISTKICIYQALVQSVLQYAAETWTLLATDIKALEAFHVKCQRQLLYQLATVHPKRRGHSDYWLAVDLESH